MKRDVIWRKGGITAYRREGSTGPDVELVTVFNNVTLLPDEALKLAKALQQAFKEEKRK